MTENVTWLSPAACDAGRQAADVPRDRRNGGQAMRVLVTEDDEILAAAVAAGLRREGMAVDVALDGAAALEHVAVNRYDVVVLDRDLPGVHGDACYGSQGCRTPPTSPATGLVDHCDSLTDCYRCQPFVQRGR